MPLSFNIVLFHIRYWSRII